MKPRAETRGSSHTYAKAPDRVTGPGSELTASLVRDIHGPLLHSAATASRIQPDSAKQPKSRLPNARPYRTSLSHAHRS